jgi:DNA-binding protein HU-beta
MATTMSQTQLLHSISEACELPTKTVKTMITALSAIAVQETKKNGVFVVPGIGRLVKVDRKARIGRNPATGESIKIAAKKVVKFRIAKSVKDAVIPPPKVKK